MVSVDEPNLTCSYPSQVKMLENVDATNALTMYKITPNKKEYNNILPLIFLNPVSANVCFKFLLTIKLYNSSGMPNSTTHWIKKAERNSFLMSPKPPSIKIIATSVIETKYINPILIMFLFFIFYYFFMFFKYFFNFLIYFAKFTINQNTIIKMIETNR